MAKEINNNFEAQLFKTADKLRKNIDAAEYKNVVLGLVFLKYISDSFQELYEKLEADEYSDPEDRDEYKAENVFFVPEQARWKNLHARAKLPTIGTDLDDAMEAIEKENPELRNVLSKVYGKPNLDKTSLGELIDVITDIELKAAHEHTKDLLGRVYEYFLGEFANAEGKKGGQFYTPKAIVKLMVEMIEPYKGRVYDPACGSGGMFVMSEKFVEEHQGNIQDITIYGQESNQTTWKLSKMNLAIRNINSQFVAWNTEGSFLRDAHPDLKADFVIANPPFNQSEWGQEILQDDARWKYGVPPSGNANFGWIQHMLYHLAPHGVMATVLANGSLSSNTSGEGEIRKNLVLADLVDCIVALPKQLFYNTGIPACVWFLRRERTERKGETLFIDASEMGYMKDSAHRDLDEKDIYKIADTYRTWRKDGIYKNEIGFCKTVSLADIEKYKFDLTPGRYVGVNSTPNNDVPFEFNIKIFNSFLKQETEKQKILDTEISKSFQKYFPNINWSNISYSSNEILEELMQRIFHEWFGKYSIDDELPEGWKVGRLGDVVKNFDSQRIPITSGKRTKGVYPYYGATGINDYVENYIFDGIYTLLGEDGSVIRDNGKPFTQYVWGKIWVNNHAHVLQGKNGFSTELIKLILDKTNIAPYVNGAVQLKINQANMNSIPVIIPTLEILKEFDKIIQPIFSRLRNNLEQLQSLSKTRDELLPRLMSEEVKV